jgi:hypothetical protein
MRRAHHSFFRRSHSFFHDFNMHSLDPRTRATRILVAASSRRRAAGLVHGRFTSRQGGHVRLYDLGTIGLYDHHNMYATARTAI